MKKLQTRTIECTDDIIGEINDSPGKTKSYYGNGLNKVVSVDSRFNVGNGGFGN